MSYSDLLGGYGLDSEKEQDRFLPIANVARIMKRALPDNAKIAKDAKECVQECVSEFIAFVTSEASDRCQQEKRKTINGEDILWALQSLGFENYFETLKVYLYKYRESQRIDRSSAGPSGDEGSSSSVPTEQNNNTEDRMLALNQATALAYALSLQQHQQQKQLVEQSPESSNGSSSQQHTGALNPPLQTTAPTPSSAITTPVETNDTMQSNQTIPGQQTPRPTPSITHEELQQQIIQRLRQQIQSQAQPFGHGLTPQQVQALAARYALHLQQKQSRPDQ
ncbi:hypothetical protein HDU85_002493 [Gaertneriomyces sp. JEL0708]|nr:hypothetical protein HDU85_002493 [Gaertneriomyces sp. JEL0708]